MENQEPKHQRRVRYKGTHPRTYKEKYKELQPEKICGYHLEKSLFARVALRQVCTFLSVYKGKFLWIFLQIAAGTAGSGCHLGIWRTQFQNAGMSAAEGTSLRSGCRPH